MKKRLLITMLAFVACLVGFTAHAMLSTYVRFRGMTRVQNNNYLCAGIVESIWGTFQTPTQSGETYTFNNYVIRGEADITLNGTLKFQRGTSLTDVITHTDFTVTIESNSLWFYGALVSGTSVSGCSVSVSSDKHTVTVTIPENMIFGYIYLDYVPNEPISSSNTTISGIDSEYIYYGSPVEPVPTVSYYGTTLTESTDYTLSYSGSNGAGTARVTVNGTGSYTGSVYKSYTIRNIALSDFNSLGNNTYEIATKEDLLNLACFVNYAGNNCQGLTFKQTADITCDNTYIPIGDYNHSFNGTYDGQGHTISGITVSRTGSGDANSYLGVFGNLGAGGVVKDIVLAQSSFTGANRVGGIVGYNNGGTVRDCRVESGVSVMTSVNNSYDHGGVVGLNIGGSSLIAGCVSAAAVSNSGKTDCKEYGGIAGGNNNGATIRDCLYTGGIVTASNNIGAIAGYITNGNFTNNYYTSSGIYGANGSDRDGARRARTVTLVGDISLVGEETAYNLSGLTAIGTDNYALRSDTTLYSGATQTLTIHYNGEVPEGYLLSYLMTYGSLTTTLNDSIFTMPDDNVTINATLTAIDYTIALPTDLEHATITCDKATAHVGDTVTLTVTPEDDSYIISSLTVMNGDTPLEVTEGENNTYTFVMPAASVIVSVEMQRLRYTFNSETGALKLFYGEFNKDNKWGSEVQPDSVKSVTATSDVSFTGDCSELFYGFNKCESMYLNSVNTSEMTNCYRMFYWCYILDTLDLSGWDTGNVTSMKYMFGFCSSLTSLDLSNFNTAGVTDMSTMFYECKALTSLDLSNFNTANVTDMSDMFSGCSSLLELDLSNFNTGKVEYMNEMFQDCSSLTSLDLSNFDTGNVTDMGKMFQDCSSLPELDLSNFNTGKVEYMNEMFQDCSSLPELDLSNFNTGNVTDMSRMFQDCSSLPELDLSNFNTGNVTDMSDMFSGCSSLLELDLSNFNTAGVTDMSTMFYKCNSLTTIYAGSGWSTESVEESDFMFFNCFSLVGGMGTTYNSSHVDKEYARIDGGPDCPGYFTSNQLPRYTFNSTTGELKLNWGEFNKDDKWGDEVDPRDVKTVTATNEVSFTGDCSTLFYNFTQCTSMDLSNVNTDSVTLINSMFGNCWSLTTLDVSGWNTSNVTNMGGIFTSCSSLTTIDLSSWNTSRVTNMGSMFAFCPRLTTIDLSGWNTASVTDMNFMFSGCSNLKTLELSTWDVSNVSEMYNMFSNCDSLQTVDVSGWNTSNVTDMGGMFCDCESLTTIHAGPSWSTARLFSSNNMFTGSTSLVGGMGTTYDANHTDAEYARIDGGPDCPGYFTRGSRYTFNSTTGELKLLWGEFNKNDKWGDDVDEEAVTSVTATSEVSFTGDCSELFYDFYNCKSMDLSNVNTDSVTNMSEMFSECRDLISLDVSGWNTANVTNMGCMFNDCWALTSLDLSGWNTTNLTDMSAMFFNCSSLTTLDLSGWNTANVTDMSNMFHECTNLTSLDISSWNTANVTDMRKMFYYCWNMTSLDISGWNTGNVINMSHMFDYCGNLTTIYAGAGWSTESVEEYGSDQMFYNCTSLVGGMGTTFDEDHTDAEYARIDGGPDCPGYFTDKNPVVVVTGDVDGDGFVTTVDITAIYNYLLNGDETYIATSDVDGDGYITTTDITVIYNILLGNKK